MRLPTLLESPLRLHHGDWAKSTVQKVDICILKDVNVQICECFLLKF